MRQGSIMLYEGQALREAQAQAGGKLRDRHTGSALRSNIPITRRTKSRVSAAA